MIKTVKLRELRGKDLDRLFNRYGDDFSPVLETVIPIVNDVRKNGDEAVRRYTEKFDKIKIKSLTVTEDEIESGCRNASREILSAFMKARENIEEFHSRQKKEMIRYTRPDGTTLGLMYQPIQRAAMYVPGGKASYPSSVLMGIIPARIAGTKDITVVTPPDRNGKIQDMILAICRELGVSKIFKSGGAQGIAAVGFGTESAGKADIIVGPGNIYVTAAKSYLFSLGAVQIDSMAGPSEVLIIADEKADPEWVAYDLLSQAEHEERAIPVLVTPSADLAEKVSREIEKDLKNGLGRHEIKKKSVSTNGLIILAETIDEAIQFSNSYAPEHMEFMVQESEKYLPQIRNVGSLFLGYYSPVAAGDYFSGTNHILPTGGGCRFSSGLSVETFLRRTTFQNLTESALRNAREPVRIMSAAEGFDDKHGGSVDIRFRKD